MQHFKRHSAQSDDVVLNYADGGSGPAVVYIHGTLTALDEGLIGLGDAFAGSHRFIAFDRPGHGGSGEGEASASAWRQAELIHGVVQSLGLEKPVIIGHSFGGAVAAAYGLQFPDDIAGVVALAPICFPEPRLEQTLLGLRAFPVSGTWFNAMAEPWDAMVLPVLWRAMFLPQPMPAAFADGFPFAASARRSQLRADGEEALRMASDLGRSAVAYRHARVPLRVLQGDRDAVVSPERHGRLMSLLWPNSQFTSLPGLGHMAHHFSPEAVVAAVRSIEADSLDRAIEPVAA